MAKMRVMVMKCGFATVEAETESEAIEIAERMADSEFDQYPPHARAFSHELGGHIRFL